MTALGTVLGVAAFVAVVGLTASAGGQISKRFDALTATEVVVEDIGGADGNELADAFRPTLMHGSGRSTASPKRACGGPWTTRAASGWTGVPLPGVRAPGSIPILAASPGFLRAVAPTIRQGRVYDEVLDERAEQVVVLGSAAANRLGIVSLAGGPAVFLDGNPFTVVGILDDVRGRTRPTSSSP